MIVGCYSDVEVEEILVDDQSIENVRQEVEEILNPEKRPAPRTDYDIFCEKYFYLFQPSETPREFLGAGA